MKINTRDKDHEKQIENSIKEENDNLIGNISSNIRDFKNLNNDLNSKINSTNKFADKMHNKFSKSTTGIEGETKNLTEVISKKSGSICWFIVFIFVLIFFIRKFISINKIITNEENLVNKFSNNTIDDGI